MHYTENKFAHSLQILQNWKNNIDLKTLKISVVYIYLLYDSLK